MKIIIRLNAFLLFFFVFLFTGCNVKMILKQRNISRVYVANSKFTNSYQRQSYIFMKNKKKNMYFSQHYLNTADSDIIIKSKFDYYGFINRIIIKNRESKTIVKILRNKNKQIKEYATIIKKDNNHTSLFTRYEYIYRNDSFIVRKIRRDTLIYETVYKLDTSITCFFPHYLITSYSPDFFMFSNYISHPIISCRSDEKKYSDFVTTIDKSNYVTQVKEYDYIVTDYNDTILTDSTVFEIFYEE